MTNYNSQVGPDGYKIQFETDNRLTMSVYSKSFVTALMSAPIA